MRVCALDVSVWPDVSAWVGAYVVEKGTVDLLDIKGATLELEAAESVGLVFQVALFAAVHESGCGTKRTWRSGRDMSAIGGKAEVAYRGRKVRF
jgi:hypothetical protein